MKTKNFKDSAEDQKLQKEYLLRANYSLAILGKAFVRNGSGRFVNIRRVSVPKAVCSR